MDTHQFFLLLAVSMGLVILLDLISETVRGEWVSEPMIAMFVGFALGPEVGGLIDLQKLGKTSVLLEHAAQLTLAIGLMGVALRLPPLFYNRFRRTLTVLLLPGMVLMWLSASTVAYFTLGIPLLTALLLGAIVTPTDPVISTSIVTGDTAKRNLPRRLRHSISTESGFNDGLAYPLVMLPIALITSASASEGVKEWLIDAWLRKTILGAVIGLIMGGIAALILRRAERTETIEIHSLLSYTVALSLSTLAAAHLAGTNGILAVFVAGVAFAYMANPSERVEEENVQEAANRLFTLPAFLLLGLAAPWKEWFSFGWGAVMFVLFLLLLRRPPVWLLLSSLTPGLRRREMIFAGWFGPVGIAALYYSLHAEKETGLPMLWPLTSLVICASVLIHGATAAPLARVLGRVDRRERDEVQA